MDAEYVELSRERKRTIGNVIGNINRILLNLAGYAGLVFVILMYKDLENLRYNVEEIFNKTQLLEIFSDTDQLEQCILKIATFIINKMV